jgi:hypothetical protein
LQSACYQERVGHPTFSPNFLGGPIRFHLHARDDKPSAQHSQRAGTPWSDDDHLAEIDQLMCDCHPLPDRDQ